MVVPRYCWKAQPLILPHLYITLLIVMSFRIRLVLLNHLIAEPINRHLQLLYHRANVTLLLIRDHPLLYNVNITS